jgi:uncharacterized protein (DUF1697 family)
MPAPQRVAFLRAINVGGHTVTMDALKAHFRDAGFTNVESFIASGNIVFQSKTTDATAVERKIEKQLEQALGYEVKTFVRTVAEVAAVAAYTPFPPAILQRARVVYVGFLAAPMSAAEQKTLGTLATDIDRFQTSDRELYWASLGQQGESKFTNNVFERALKLRTTFRGINTVVRLAAKYPPVAD